MISAIITVIQNPALIGMFIIMALVALATLPVALYPTTVMTTMDEAYECVIFPGIDGFDTFVMQILRIPIDGWINFINNWLGWVVLGFKVMIERSKEALPYDFFSRVANVDEGIAVFDAVWDFIVLHFPFAGRNAIHQLTLSIFPTGIPLWPQLVDMVWNPINTTAWEITVLKDIITSIVKLDIVRNSCYFLHVTDLAEERWLLRGCFLWQDNICDDPVYDEAVHVAGNCTERYRRDPSCLSTDPGCELGRDGCHLFTRTMVMLIPELWENNLNLLSEVFEFIDNFLLSFKYDLCTAFPDPTADCSMVGPTTMRYAGVSCFDIQPTTIYSRIQFMEDLDVYCTDSPTLGDYVDIDHMDCSMIQNCDVFLANCHNLPPDGEDAPYVPCQPSGTYGCAVVNTNVIFGETTCSALNTFDIPANLLFDQYLPESCEDIADCEINTWAQSVVNVMDDVNAEIMVYINAIGESISCGVDWFKDFFITVNFLFDLISPSCEATAGEIVPWVFTHILAHGMDCSEPVAQAILRPPFRPLVTAFYTTWDQFKIGFQAITQGTIFSDSWYYCTKMTAVDPLCEHIPIEYCTDTLPGHVGSAVILDTGLLCLATVSSNNSIDYCPHFSPSLVTLCDQQIGGVKFPGITCEQLGQCVVRGPEPCTVFTSCTVFGGNCTYTHNITNNIVDAWWHTMIEEMVAGWGDVVGYNVTSNGAQTVIRVFGHIGELIKCVIDTFKGGFGWLNLLFDPVCAMPGSELITFFRDQLLRDGIACFDEISKAVGLMGLDPVEHIMLQLRIIVDRIVLGLFDGSLFSNGCLWCSQKSWRASVGLNYTTTPWYFEGCSMFVGGECEALWHACFTPLNNYTVPPCGHCPDICEGFPPYIAGCENCDACDDWWGGDPTYIVGPDNATLIWTFNNTQCTHCIDPIHDAVELVNEITVNITAWVIGKIPFPPPFDAIVLDLFLDLISAILNLAHCLIEALRSFIMFWVLLFDGSCSLGSGWKFLYLFDEVIIKILSCFGLFFAELFGSLWEFFIMLAEAGIPFFSTILNLVLGIIQDAETFSYCFGTDGVTDYSRFTPPNPPPFDKWYFSGDGDTCVRNWPGDPPPCALHSCFSHAWECLTFENDTISISEGQYCASLTPTQAQIDPRCQSWTGIPLNATDPNSPYWAGATYASGRIRRSFAVLGFMATDVFRNFVVGVISFVNWIVCFGVCAGQCGECAWYHVLPCFFQCFGNINYRCNLDTFDVSALWPDMSSYGCFEKCGDLDCPSEDQRLVCEAFCYLTEGANIPGVTDCSKTMIELIDFCGVQQNIIIPEEIIVKKKDREKLCAAYRTIFIDLSQLNNTAMYPPAQYPYLQSDLSAAIDGNECRECGDLYGYESPAYLGCVGVRLLGNYLYSTNLNPDLEYSGTLCTTSVPAFPHECGCHFRPFEDGSEDEHTIEYWICQLSDPPASGNIEWPYVRNRQPIADAFFYDEQYRHAADPSPPVPYTGVFMMYCWEDFPLARFGPETQRGAPPMIESGLKPEIVITENHRKRFWNAILSEMKLPIDCDCRQELSKYIPGSQPSKSEAPMWHECKELLNTAKAIHHKTGVSVPEIVCPPKKDGVESVGEGVRRMMVRAVSNYGLMPKSVSTSKTARDTFEWIPFSTLNATSAGVAMREGAGMIKKIIGESPLYDIFTSGQALMREPHTQDDKTRWFVNNMKTLKHKYSTNIKPRPHIPPEGIIPHAYYRMKNSGTTFGSVLGAIVGGIHENVARNSRQFRESGTTGSKKSWFDSKFSRSNPSEATKIRRTKRSLRDATGSPEDRNQTFNIAESLFNRHERAELRHMLSDIAKGAMSPIRKAALHDREARLLRQVEDTVSKWRPGMKFQRSAGKRDLEDILETFEPWLAFLIRPIAEVIEIGINYLISVDFSDIVDDILAFLETVVVCHAPDQYDGTRTWNFFCLKWPEWWINLPRWTEQVNPPDPAVIPAQIPWDPLFIVDDCIIEDRIPRPYFGLHFDNCQFANFSIPDPYPTQHPLCDWCHYCERTYDIDSAGPPSIIDNLLTLVGIIQDTFNNFFEGVPNAIDDADRFHFIMNCFLKYILTGIIGAVIAYLVGQIGVMVAQNAPIFVAIYIIASGAFMWGLLMIIIHLVVALQMGMLATVVAFFLVMLVIGLLTFLGPITFLATFDIVCVITSALNWIITNIPFLNLIPFLLNLRDSFSDHCYGPNPVPPAHIQLMLLYFSTTILGVFLVIVGVMLLLAPFVNFIGHLVLFFTDIANTLFWYFFVGLRNSRMRKRVNRLEEERYYERYPHIEGPHVE